ncbi:MAG: DUF3656 domain-containing protein [Eubacteriales bacterium]
MEFLSEPAAVSNDSSAAAPELLSPAGSPDSLRAALAAGADAVYFGGASFSNRMRARNFGEDELSDAVRLCHSAGAAAHITVNTRVRDREMDDLLRFADRLLSAPSDAVPDAFIVADFGAAREIHRRFPGLSLHASTQTSLSSLSDCRMLEEMGFSRLVVPRELTREEIQKLCAAAPLEIEMFLHGAHCVSLSGQCLLSCMMGGRSGNRGECAQPCRLPFTLRRCDHVNRGNGDVTGHPLSLADLCLAGRIPEVLGTGVRSLKIEGRLKSPDYVYGTTKIYRILLDERRSATDKERKALADLFSRGFTDGYFSYNYTCMASRQVSGESAKTPSISKADIDQALDQRLRSREVQATCVPLSAEFRLLSGEPARFTLALREAPEHAVSVTGDAPQTADGKPLTAASAAKNLTKFGDTKYSLSADDITFVLGEHLWYPVSALNQLRRDALALLESETEQQKPDAPSEVSAKPVGSTAFLPYIVPDSPPKTVGKPIRTAEVADLRTLFDPPVSQGFAEFFDTVYVPAHTFAEAVEKAKNQPFPTELAAVLPPLMPSDENTEALLEAVKAAGRRRVLCHTLGQVSLARQHGLLADMSFRANLTNTAAFAEYRRIGCERIVLSPEIPPAAVAGIGGGAIVYGRLPLMTLARCVICGGKCPFGRHGGRAANRNKYSLEPNSKITKSPCCAAVLRDRKGEEFPVLGFRGMDCTNVVYNAVPTWMADRADQLRPIAHQHFLFTTETSEEADRVVRAYLEKRPYARGRRM